MKSLIYTGKVMHSRLEPKSHTFSYPVYFYGFDLDQLQLLAKKNLFFSYNKRNVTSIFDQDYLVGSGTIKDKLLNYLSEQKFVNLDVSQIKKVFLITSARYFNYVFNPVSFYYCYNSESEIVCIVAEVNNTFGERHLYTLGKDFERDPNKFAKHYLVPKDFHVSPFYSMEGDYDFWFSDITEQLDIRINIQRDSRTIFYSKQIGKAQDFNTLNLLKTILRFPLTASLTMPRILFQAFVLHYKKGLKVYKKPYAQSLGTVIKSKIKYKNRLGMRYLFKVLQQAEIGVLTFNLPDQTCIRFGKPHKHIQANIDIIDYDFFSEILFSGDIALGETFVANYWQSSNIANLIEWCLLNRSVIEKRNKMVTAFFEKLNYLKHKLNFNTLVGSKKNIQKHYDLSNELFALFLDPTMTYSSAYFESENQSLEAAQYAKLDRLINSLQIDPEHKILEIGSGWGSMAIRIAQRTGAKVTTITLSEKQKEEAERRISLLKLQDQVHVKLCDFREISGTFDRIVSVEMFEAIGYENYTSFFKSCERLLSQNGLIALQVITIPDQRFDGLRKRCDWIQKHIFPGSLIPSIQAINDAASKASNFIIEEMINIGPHYAKTLNIWRANFNQQIAAIKAAGFDQEFIRAWNYYFAYCEAAFKTRTLNTHQLLMTRPQNTGLKSFKVSQFNEVSKLNFQNS